MFNNDFDPYAELVKCQNNIIELAKGYNAQTDAIKQLLEQNRKLNDLIRSLRLEVGRLHADVELIRIKH